MSDIKHVTIKTQETRTIDSFFEVLLQHIPDLEKTLGLEPGTPMEGFGTIAVTATLSIIIDGGPEEDIEVTLETVR